MGYRFRPCFRNDCNMGLKDKSKANKLTGDCLILLNALGFMAWRQNNHATPVKDKKTGKVIAFQKMSHGSRKGVSDIICVSKPYGTFIALEVKIGKDKLSSDQIEFRNDLLKVNAKYFVITCIDDLMALIKNDDLRYMPKVDK